MARLRRLLQPPLRLRRSRSFSWKEKRVMKKWLNRLAIGCGSLLALLVIAGVALFYATRPSERFFRWVVSDATRVEVRQGGMVPRTGVTPKIWFEVDEPHAVRELIDNLRIIDPGNMIISCGSQGNPTFDFYKGSKLITSVALHHGHRVRAMWWLGDATLTEDSRQYLLTLLKSHGLTEDDFR